MSNMPKILHCIWNFLLFIAARNETSREKPAQKPGVSRSVDGTPGQLSTGLGHTETICNLRQEGEGRPAFCLQRTEFVPITSAPPTAPSPTPRSPRVWGCYIFKGTLQARFRQSCSLPSKQKIGAEVQPRTFRQGQGGRQYPRTKHTETLVPFFWGPGGRNKSPGCQWPSSSYWVDAQRGLS